MITLYFLHHLGHLLVNLLVDLHISLLVQHHHLHMTTVKFQNLMSKCPDFYEQMSEF